MDLSAWSISYFFNIYYKGKLVLTPYFSHLCTPSKICMHSTYRLSRACYRSASVNPHALEYIHPSIQSLAAQELPTTIALKLTLPSAQSVDMVDPLAIATVPSALVKVATTGPVPPLNGTAKWFAPGSVTWRIVAGLFPIWTDSVAGPVVRVSTEIWSRETCVME